MAINVRYNSAGGLSLQTAYDTGAAQRRRQQAAEHKDFLRQAQNYRLQQQAMALQRDQMEQQNALARSRSASAIPSSVQTVRNPLAQSVRQRQQEPQAQPIDYQTLMSEQSQGTGEMSVGGERYTLNEDGQVVNQANRIQPTRVTQPVSDRQQVTVDPYAQAVLQNPDIPQQARAEIEAISRSNMTPNQKRVATDAALRRAQDVGNTGTAGGSAALEPDDQVKLRVRGIDDEIQQAEREARELRKMLPEDVDLTGGMDQFQRTRQDRNVFQVPRQVGGVMVNPFGKSKYRESPVAQYRDEYEQYQAARQRLEELRRQRQEILGGGGAPDDTFDAENADTNELMRIILEG